MEIPKDIYLKIAETSEDDRTILSMLSVNKKYYNEEFFKRIFQKRYPLLIQYKKENQSWKDYYISTIYHLKTLEEIYNIPYIAVSSFNPELLLSEAKKRTKKMFVRKSKVEKQKTEGKPLRGQKLRKDVEKKVGMEIVYPLYAEDGNLQKVEEMVDSVDTHTRFNARKSAVLGDKVDVVEYLLQNGLRWKQEGDGGFLDFEDLVHYRDEIGNLALLAKKNNKTNTFNFLKYKYSEAGGDYFQINREH